MQRTINRHPSIAVLYLGAFAAVLALSIIEAGAIDIASSITVPPGNAGISGGGAVNIRNGATLTVNEGGTITSTGNWHVGQGSGGIGTVTVNSGGTVFTGELRLGDSADAQGTLNVNGGRVVSTQSGTTPATLAAVKLAGANRATGTVNVTNGGELQTTGISFGLPTGGGLRASLSLPS